MSVSYGELKTLVNNANKTTINKSFEVIEKRIQKEYIEQNKEEIKYIKDIIKKVKENKATKEDLTILFGNEKVSKEEKLDFLNNLLKGLKNVSIPHNFTIMIETLSKPLQNLINPSNKTRKILKQKEILPPKKKPEFSKIRKEVEEERDILAKQVVSIEPLDFFVLLPFYTLTPEQTNVLEEILDLDENMMPNKYTIFETFNIIVEKRHLTGEYFEYNIKQSQISKKFMELEPEIRETLFDFTKLNKKAIQKAREEMIELITVVQILYDFEPKDYSSLSSVIIKNIIRIYNNLIKNSKDDENIIKYLTRSIQLLEHRRKKMHEELPQLIKDDDKRKFLTKETAGLIQPTIPETQPLQQVQQGDEELGEHYDDRFEDEGFDDLDLDLNVVEEEDSLLLGGNHPLKEY